MTEAIKVGRAQTCQTPTHFKTVVLTSMLGLFPQEDAFENLLFLSTYPQPKDTPSPSRDLTQSDDQIL